MTENSPGKKAWNVAEGQEQHYRLWCRARTKGNPIVILVHGAVVPLPGAFHDPNNMNNDKYCFYDLDSLLYGDFQYNVFTFEYADQPTEFGYVNYGDLKQYGNCLIDAIGWAKKTSQKQDGTVGPVTIIAHCMGGLVARYAAILAPGTISKIITLDTGHKGFALANFVVNLLNEAHITLPPGTECTKEAEVGSGLINTLNANVDTNNPKLVSLAATKPIPPGFFVWPAILPFELKVVGSDSSNMGDFYSLDYHHVEIAQIKASDHGAYQIIKNVIP